MNLPHGDRIPPTSEFAKGEFRIGVISDTHGLLRPEAVAALQGAAMILHAGDIDSPQVLEGLRAIAPVTAVRGNVDRESWARKLPLTEAAEAAGVMVYLIHNLHELDLDPKAAGIGVVISGHSHQPLVERSDGVLYLNPGSAGPRRFRLPVTVAMLRIKDGHATARIIDLSEKVRK